MFNNDKIEKMRITEHFKQRLEQRTNYSIETFLYDLESRKDEIVKLTKNSKDILLDIYPYLKLTFDKYPSSSLFLIESLNVCLVSDNKSLITLYNTH